MMRNQHRNPWYRGYMPRSYIAPHRLASFGCSMCLIAFGIFFLFAGTMLTVISNVVKKGDEDPRFQDDFFKKARENRPDFAKILRTVGIVVLCLGGIFILSSVGLCCFAKFHMDKRGNPAATPLNQAGSTYPPPPPGSYPQQQPPPPGSYPQQQPPPGSYPPQQPPPPGSYPPSSGYPQQYAPVPGLQQPMMTSYQEQTAPPTAYPYPPPTQPPPSEHYVNEKNAPYPEYQGPTTTNAPPVGFKEG